MLLPLVETTAAMHTQPLATFDIQERHDVSNRIPRVVLMGIILQ